MQISSQLRGQSWQSQVSKTQWDPSAIDRFVDSPSAHVSEARRESISIPVPTEHQHHDSDQHCYTSGADERHQLYEAFVL